jgi:hypothetical protein
MSMINHDVNSQSRTTIHTDSTPTPSTILADALFTGGDNNASWWKDADKLKLIMACAGGDEIGLKSLHEAEARAASERASLLSKKMDAETQAAANFKANQAVLTMADITATVASVDKDAYEKACQRKWGTCVPTPASSAFAALGSLHISPRNKNNNIGTSTWS